MQSTIVRSWYLVRFRDVPDVEILWGIIESDPSGRWQPGDFVRTSPILEKRDGGVFVTRNTAYHTQGDGKTVELSAADYPRLSAGFSPDEIEGMKELEAHGYTVVEPKS